VLVQSPNRAEVERIVEEHLREQEQQRDGDGNHRPG
jgi:hypothetical protein